VRGRVRFTGQFIDATTGGHIWADRFDGALEDVFDLQDQVTARVVGPLSQRSNAPRSSVRDGSRPRASTLTTTSYAEWPVFICTIETASWKRAALRARDAPPLRRAEDRVRLIESLRKAGLPE
jgi:hypothetical protein